VGLGRRASRWEGWDGKVCGLGRWGPRWEGRGGKVCGLGRWAPTTIISCFLPLAFVFFFGFAYAEILILESKLSEVNSFIKEREEF